MDGETFRADLEAEKRTQLDRLGSEKFLLALTDADLAAGPILEAAAASEHAAKVTFEEWTGAEPDDEAREAFAEVAAQEAEHYERVVAHLEGYTPPDAAGPLHAYLREREDTIGRIAAGLVGRPLVSTRTYTQIIGFFINEAARAETDLFRDLKQETEAVMDTGTALLEGRCETDEDWERAMAAAEYVIQIAYDDYADALRGMGLDPKPIC